MRISYLIAMMLSVPCMSTQAQQARCHTNAYVQHLVDQDPSVLLGIQQADQQTQAIVQQGVSSRMVVTIPVVFHIIHNGEAVGSGPNISDDQIISQVDVLNEDYRRWNADTVNTPVNFLPVAADVEIEFQLAIADEYGTPSNGITRTDLGQQDWPTFYAIDNNAKPATIWDRDFYLNIWVLNMDNSILGYATPPGAGGPTTDGVVLDYRFVGRQPFNTYPTIYNGGRTATHEVGHYLGLGHIWGNQNGCFTDDGIADTPPADGPNYGCPIGQQSCGTDEMPQNYMDYTDDDCMNIWTQGQATVQRGVANGFRSTLQNSPGLGAPTFAFSGRVVDAQTSQGVSFAKVLFVNADGYEVEATADGSGNFTSSSFKDDDYTVYAGKWGYKTRRFATNFTVQDGDPLVIISIDPGQYYDDFILDFNWVVLGNAATGAWERGEPEGTEFNYLDANPDFDVVDDLGYKCFVTGNAGGMAGNDDVDDGNALLRSPLFDLTSINDPEVSYARWFFNDGGNGDPLDDALTISISNGSQTAVLETVTAGEANSNSWKYKTFRISDFVAPSSTMNLFIETADNAVTGHIVEAGFDFFSVEAAFGVGVADVEKPAHFAVYPNPTKDHIQVELGFANAVDYDLRLFNSVGQQIRSWTGTGVDSEKLTIDASTLAAGVYTLQVAAGQVGQVQRVVVLD